MRQSSPPIARATSDGQILASFARVARSATIAPSIRAASPPSLRPAARHRSLHQRTSSQLRAQAARQVIVRPHATHGLLGRSARCTFQASASRTARTRVRGAIACAVVHFSVAARGRLSGASDLSSNTAPSVNFAELMAVSIEATEPEPISAPRSSEVTSCPSDFPGWIL